MLKSKIIPAWADRHASAAGANALIGLAGLTTEPYSGPSNQTWFRASCSKVLVIPTMISGCHFAADVATAMREEETDAIVVRVATTPLITRLDLSIVKQSTRGSYEHWWHRYCLWLDEDGCDLRFVADPEGRPGPVFALCRDGFQRRYDVIDSVDASLGVRSADIALSRQMAEAR